jgi:acyl-CoA thioesterase FadM
MGCELEIRGRVLEISGRRITVETTVLAEGVATARGRVVAAQITSS